MYENRFVTDIVILCQMMRCRFCGQMFLYLFQFNGLYFRVRVPIRRG
ncbi:hypothetical protein NEILACOT_03695 [Neisseria lactamica ATCC 23970]|uniref:Uncharacterized protein n=1 Tax=Neisseria lactamica ATCC 23970 TaxID=546265 RepID=D0W842_NEILA|nr:hypothetical protein NEILACOT_03695 [Neisseria lactamica ATCC 23970]